MDIYIYMGKMVAEWGYTLWDTTKKWMYNDVYMDVQHEETI
jgi:hypothetical protein